LHAHHNRGNATTWKSVNENSPFTLALACDNRIIRGVNALVMRVWTPQKQIFALREREMLQKSSPFNSYAIFRLSTGRLQFSCFVIIIRLTIFVAGWKIFGFPSRYFILSNLHIFFITIKIFIGWDGSNFLYLKQ
jgi:hypothetical protein